MYKIFFKPFFDFFFSVVVLLLTSPIILTIIILLYFFNDKKVFFLQTRPGKNEKLFNIVKFKTMNDNKDNDGNLLPDKFRLTRLGSFLRKSSLDELLQLINVIKGDMSLIGPRPLLVKYLPIYTELQRKRHSVKPGITGWAQVNGRNAISWNQKFKLDVFYVDNYSFLLDVKILFLTIINVFARKGISAVDQATAEEFNGNN